MDRSIATPVERTCRDCGWQWLNVEIPMANVWTGLFASMCPLHLRWASSKARVTPQRMVKYKEMTSAFLLCVSVGASYCRRECRYCHYCPHERKRHNDLGCMVRDCRCRCYKPCEQPDGRPTRWTVMEVDAGGRVMENVTKCPRCGGMGRASGKRDWAVRQKYEKSARRSARVRARNQIKENCCDTSKRSQTPDDRESDETTR